MNPGALEEGAKVAGSFVDSLKAQPLALALVVMNLALLGLLYYVAQGVSETRRREVALIYDQQKQVQDILSHCVVVDPNKPR
jgi:hypothetical protein